MKHSHLTWTLTGLLCPVPSMFSASHRYEPSWFLEIERIDNDWLLTTMPLFGWFHNLFPLKVHPILSGGGLLKMLQLNNTTEPSRISSSFSSAICSRNSGGSAKNIFDSSSLKRPFILSLCRRKISVDRNKSLRSGIHCWKIAVYFNCGIWFAWKFKLAPWF